MPFSTTPFSVKPLLGKATIIPVDPDLLDYYWPLLSDYIERSLEHSDSGVPLLEIRSDIATHKMQLWAIKYENGYIAAVVTKIDLTHSQQLSGTIAYAGGSQHELWDQFVDVIGAWFKSQGCTYMDIIGRPGWLKLYKERGFKTVMVQIRRELNGQRQQTDLDTVGNGPKISGE